MKPIRIPCSCTQCFQIISGIDLVSHMLQSQYIAVRMCRRFVTTEEERGPRPADRG